MYFDELLIVKAVEYMKECKAKSLQIEYYVSMCKYFDDRDTTKGLPEGDTIPRITLRAQYNQEKDRFDLMVTPYYEFWRYAQLEEDYKRILTSGFLIDKVQELSGEERFSIKVDNRKSIYHGSSSDLYEGFYECEHDEFFFYKKKY
jgi:hypothetical protein